MCIINFKKTHTFAQLPQKANESDSGYDVFALQDIDFARGETKFVDTGLQLAFISYGYEIQVRAKSGLARKFGLRVVNAPGTIDNGYRGSIGLILACDVACSFKTGDKIAQLVPMAIPDSAVGWSDEVTETKRGAGGFGSTGA